MLQSITMRVVHNIMIFFIQIEVGITAAVQISSLDIETKFPYFLFLTWLSIIRYQEFYIPSISSLTGKCAAQK